MTCKLESNTGHCSKDFGPDTVVHALSGELLWLNLHVQPFLKSDIIHSELFMLNNLSF